VFVRAQIWLDGGAYLSSSAAVVGNAGLMGIGPYVVPNVRMDCYGAYTNNPPCGAMRGFGAVQAAFGYESQMDKAAAALGHRPGRAPLPQRDDRGLGRADRPGGRQPGAGGRAAAPPRGDADAGRPAG
jgi:hypothetical protein